MSEWPKHGSYEHGVREGARQIIEKLAGMIERGVRYDLIAERIFEMRTSTVGLSYRVPPPVDPKP